MVVDEEGVEQGGLVAEEQLVVEQAPLIVVREIDVVEMDPRAGREAGQGLQDQPVDLAPWPDRMGGIDEQEPAGAEVREGLQGHRLRPLGHQADLSRAVGRFEEFGRERLDADDLGPIAGDLLGGHQHHGRRDAAPDLDDPRRPDGLHEREQEFRVHRAEPRLAVAGARRAPDVSPRPVVEPGPAARFEELELDVGLGPADPDQAPRPLPVGLATKLADAGNLGIEVARQDVHAEPLPDLEQGAQPSLAQVLDPPLERRASTSRGCCRDGRAALGDGRGGACGVKLRGAVRGHGGVPHEGPESVSVSRIRSAPG